MSLVDKIKLLLQLRKPGEELVGEIKEAKSGWKTLKFWVALLATLSTVGGVIANFIPVATGVVITTTIAVLYNLVRAVDNAQMEGVQPTLLSTRFWIGVAAIISDGLLALQHGGLTAPWITTAVGILAAVMAASQSVGSQQPSTPA